MRLKYPTKLLLNDTEIFPNLCSSISRKMNSLSDLSLSDPDQEASSDEEKPNLQGLGLKIVDIPTENGSSSSSKQRKRTVDNDRCVSFEQKCFLKAW